ncbi:MAG TPA: NAD-dependent epimerase/dehydratase family protein [Gemmatimonadales bacterium]|nr:NAD-dependent epimerase/dehydratase family protein [Gemmatimonadales bacterium]
MVTGAAGFIGSHLAERLVALGHSVRVVDNLSTGDEANLVSIAREIEFIHDDLCVPTVCQRAVAGVEIVFHLAALPSVPRSLKDPWASHAANVNATMRLLGACVDAKVQRVVYSSSSSVYGDTPVLPKTESVEPLPRSPYAASKLAGEQYVLAFARAGLVEGVALRYFNVFGPRQSPHSAYAAVIPHFLQAALDGHTAELYGDGQQTRDFTYVDNVVEANILAAWSASELVSGWPVNVGAGTRTSLLGLIDLIRTITGRRLPYVRHRARSGDVRDSLASLDRAQRLLGYRPSVSLEEGLRRTWAWFEQESSAPAKLAANGRRGTLVARPVGRNAARSA